MLQQNYPQLLLVLVETSLEHSVSYNDAWESVPVILTAVYTCYMSYSTVEILIRYEC